jgi:hypothetical protein
MFMIYLHTIFYVPDFCSLLVTAANLKADHIFHKVSVLLYIRQKCSLIRQLHIFPVTLHYTSRIPSVAATSESSHSHEGEQ